MNNPETSPPKTGLALNSHQKSDTKPDTTATKPDPGQTSENTTANTESTQPAEHGGPKGLEPTRYGDWERNGRCTDF